MQFILVSTGSIVGIFSFILTEFQSCILSPLGAPNRCMSVDGLPSVVYTRTGEECLCCPQFILV